MQRLPLHGIRVAILVADGFEQVELTEPMDALRQAGATSQVVSPQEKTVQAWNHTDWGQTFNVDLQLDQADPASYDALLLPGGVLNPDKLRMNEHAVAFVRAIAEAGKPIAAICHGPWTLINAGLVAGKTLTSYPSLRADLENAGAHWVDQAVATDGQFITSRRPDDLEEFNRAMVQRFSQTTPDAAQRDAEVADKGQVSAAPGASFAAEGGAEQIGDSPAVLAGNTLGNNSYPKGNQREQDGT